MLIHILGTALARLRRAPLSTAAATFVLALGLVAFFGAVGVAEYWRASDRAFANADRVLAIGQRLSAEEGTLGFPMAAQPVAERVAAEFPELSAVARIGRAQPFQVTVNQRVATFFAAPADPSVFDIFDFTFLAGDARSALDRPGSAILMQSTAERLFGGEPALGRSFQTTDGTSLTVTGVIAPIPRPSHMGDDAQAALLRFDYLYSWPEGVNFAGRPNWWISPNSWTYVLLPEEGLSRAAFAARLNTLPDRFMPDEQKAVRTISFEPRPLSELKAEDASRRLFGSGARASDAVTLLFALGAVVLGVACVNCANLAIARAAARIREAGIRKVLGERASWVALEHWVETALLTIAAALLALGFLWAVAPPLAAQTGIDLRVSLPGAALLGLFAAVVPLTSLATSLLPALLAARVAPVEALRSGRSKAGPRLLTQLLLALQFGTAGALVTVALVIVAQNGLVQERGLSDAQSPVVALADRRAWSATDAALRSAFEGQPGIAAVSRTSFVPWSGDDDHSHLQASAAAGAASIDAFANRVSYDFFSVFDQPLLAGRAFDPARRDTPAGTDAPSMPVVVDQSLARRLGYASPEAAVGAVIRYDRRMEEAYGRDPEFEIIGVVADRHLQFSGGQAVGNIYYLIPPDTGGPMLRIQPGQTAAAIETIEAAQERLGFEEPLNWTFVDDGFRRGFKSYFDTQIALSTLAVAALLISAIGALGIAGRLVQRRRHEVAVRKVLGATVVEAMRVLLKDFAGPVAIGILAAWPFAYLLAQAYLAAFMTRIDLTPAPFLVSLAAGLALAAVVVLGEVLKTARVPPAQVLREA
jgi:putative ABC transport system permease protein